MSGRWPVVLLCVFATHLPFFAWRWHATRERRYAATTLTFALLVLTYGLGLFAPELRVGATPLFQITRVLAWLASRPGVAGVHDLHIWSLSTTRIGLTAHLVMPGGHPGDAFLDDIAGELAEHFGIDHAALQIELGDGPACRLAPDAVI